MVSTNEGGTWFEANLQGFEPLALRGFCGSIVLAYFRSFSCWPWFLHPCWAILLRIRALQKYPRKLYSERLLGTQNIYESTNENGWLSVEWLQVIFHRKKWLEMLPFLIHVKMVGFLVPGINWVSDFIHPIYPHVSIYHQKFQVLKSAGTETL